jgi:hypothetical protein
VASIPNGVTSLTVSPNGVCFYAANDLSPYPGQVGCATFRGKTTTIDPDASLEGAVVVDQTALYWINNGMSTVRTCSIASATSCVPTSFASGVALQAGLAVNSETVYWNQFGGLHACARASECLDATAPLPGTSGVDEFAANESGVFWIATGFESGMYFCPSSGCTDGGAVVGGEDSGAQKIAATDQSLFWSNGDGVLMTCSLASGTGECTGTPTPLVATLLGSISELVADPTAVYWSDQEDDTIFRASLDGAVVTLATAAGPGAPLAIGPTCVFWADQIGSAGVLKAIAK